MADISVDVVAGNSVTVTPALTSGATISTISYSIDNTAVATIVQSGNNATITGVAAGQATVTSTANGVTSYIQVLVQPAPNDLVFTVQ